MHIVIGFSPEERLKDEAHPEMGHLSQAQVILPGDDAIVIWRERRKPDDPNGTDEVHVAAQGVWQHLRATDFRAMLQAVEAEPL